MLLLHTLLSRARGPFYLPFHYDPDYAICFSGLNLLNGVAPEHIDHPGTTLQLFAAVFLKLANIGSSNDAAIETVLAHSGAYLQGLNSALMIVVDNLLLLGVCIWQQTGKMAASLLLQATPFLLSEDFAETVRFRPGMDDSGRRSRDGGCSLPTGVARRHRASRCNSSFELPVSRVATKLNFLPWPYCLSSVYERGGAARFTWS